MTVHRCTLSAFSLALGLALFCPDITLATDLPIYGGLGGQEFRAQCPNGSYLVGLAGQTGPWVERIAPVCAAWLVAKQAFGATSVGPSHGASTGSRERHEKCWNEFVGSVYVVQSWQIDVLRSDNHYVQRIRAYCASVLPSAKSMGFYFGDKDPYDQNISSGPFGTRPPEQSCPVNEVAVGIRVRAGQFVDAIGLICGPRPLGPSAPVIKLPSPLVQAPSPAVTMNPQAKNMKIAADMFVITKPVPGQLIPHGKLIIMATAPDAPPTKGPPRYAELELRCSAAPPNLQFSYPYFHVITIEEAKLRHGYTVKEGVTGACSGAWQVRARFSLNTATGPWSAAVPFGLCHVHCPGTPPSAIQQTAPLPSSVTQAPAPSTGVAPAMVRPPTTTPPPSSFGGMIRQRGVDDKGGKEGNETVDTSAEPEKKP